jgi:hypothetical protein
MKNRFKGRLEKAEERISELGDRALEISLRNRKKTRLEKS